MMQMTVKELEYIADSLSNEDLLIKQCAVAAAAAGNPAIRQICSQMIEVHRQHYASLLGMLEQHQQTAPGHHAG
ncbi:hypothetical protein [Paenibacillus tarimensis]|nr:hypothetical protein [Paenibacillus tarimensis]